MTWILIAVALLFAVGGALTALRKNVLPPPTISIPPQSYLGINEFEDAERGVTFQDVWPPDAPADKAGLVGGDIITTFDRVPIRTGGELLSRVRRAMPRTPVEVTVIRGGETLKIPVTIG
ncbi:MAG TPA: PDZ domain-containing protein, partial [Pyrinomonadaceae bacterium]|nr:PDZ domain-containing protein [Pyrinomonadaceae bacterium]